MSEEKDLPKGWEIGILVEPFSGDSGDSCDMPHTNVTQSHGHPKRQAETTLLTN